MCIADRGMVAASWRRWPGVCPLLLLLVALGAGPGLHAQDDDGPPDRKPDTLRLQLAASAPAQRVSHSRYSHLELIDERPDKGELGWLNDGTYYGLQVTVYSPLERAFAGLLDRLKDSTAGPASLLVEMRRFIVYDNRGERNASIVFRLFAGQDGSYSWIADVDTTVSLRVGAGMGRGARRKFAAAVENAVSGAMARMLTKSGDSTAGIFTRATVVYADQVWKKQTPLYQADSLPDGIYLHYSSLANLRPDYPRTDLLDTVHPERIYAFVLHGKGFVSFEGVYTPLIKKDGEYYIREKLRVDDPRATGAANLGGIALALVGLGRLPLLQVEGLTSKKAFLMMMDYRTGRFEPVKME